MVALIRITRNAVPRAPELGEIEVRVGAEAGATTVNVTVPEVPPGVVTLTVLFPSKAVAVIVKVAVTEVPLTTTMLLTVTSVPDTLTTVAPVKFVPVSVTGTAVPWAPELGAIEVSAGAGAGAGAAPWNSTAPMSKPPPWGRVLPKKSVLGAPVAVAWSMAGEPAAKA